MISERPGKIAVLRTLDRAPHAAPFSTQGALWCGDASACSGNDLLEAAANWAQITYPQRKTKVSAFGKVTAVSSKGGADTKHIEAIDFVLDTQGPWL